MRLPSGRAVVIAADNELRLLSRAVRDRNIVPLLERGVTDDWFYVDECKEVFRFLREHFSKYGEVPTAVTVKDNFPTVRLLAVDDTIDYLLDQQQAFRHRVATTAAIEDAAVLLTQEHDHEAALGRMRQVLAEVDREHSGAGSSDIDLVASADKRYEAYEALESLPGGLLGIPTGFPTIDQATAGLQPGQLVVLVASPKVGKSVLSLQVLVNIHEAGYRTLYQSYEMSNREQESRHDAMRAGISHSRMTRGQMQSAEKVRLRRSLKRLATMPNPFVLSDAVAGQTLSSVIAKIEEHKPDLLCVDGVYLMVDEATGERGTPQALTNITRGFKNVAQRYQIPIVITTQALLWKMKKNALSAGSVGYSSSFYQDADVLLGLERTEDDDDLVRILKIIASRNCGPAEVDLEWDWEHGKFQEWTSSATTGTTSNTGTGGAP